MQAHENSRPSGTPSELRRLLAEVMVRSMPYVTVTELSESSGIPVEVFQRVAISNGEAIEGLDQWAELIFKVYADTSPERIIMEEIEDDDLDDESQWFTTEEVQAAIDELLQSREQ